MTFESPIVSVEWLNSYLGLPNLVILNASIPIVTNLHQEIYDKDLIPNSRFFDIKAKFSDISAPFPSTFPSEKQFTKEAQLLGINKDSTIVVYDDKGIYSSSRAWWLFKAFGHHSVAVLDGGLPEWNKANYTTEPFQSYNGEKGDFIGLENKKLMKFFDDVKLESLESSHIIIDARSDQRFKGLVDEPRVGLRRGTIPNSVNLPFENLLDGCTLMSADELELIFGDVAKSNDKITFSCGSGITACVLALGAEIAGYKDISVYDGSWTEWGSLTTS